MLFKRIKKRRTLFVSLIVIALMIIIFLVTNSYLLLNFWAGNDTSIKLSVDKEYVFLTHENEEELNFEASVSTNPFCSASCSYEFIDLSSNNVINEESFSIKSGNPFEKSFKVKADKIGKGKKFYRFDLNCVSEGEFLCQSNKRETTRNLLVTVEYDLNENEKLIKENIERNSLNAAYEIASFERTLNFLDKAADKLNQTAIVEYDLFKPRNLLNGEKLKLINFSLKEDYFILDNEINDIVNAVKEINDEISSLHGNISFDVNLYNELIDELKVTESILKNNTYPDYLIEEFNIAIDKFLQRDLLNNKQAVVENIRLKVENLSFANESSSMIKEANFEKIEFDNLTVNDLKLIFPNIKTICTINNVESECGSNMSYPLVFMHGHAVIKDAPLEYSLEGFSILQRELSKNGYLDAGAITLYTNENVPEGIWNLNNPLSIRASYYFDFFKEPENYKVVLTKSENIDTYAVRMKEVFDNIRKRTGREKIDVIAFSMGGLVMRRHIQLFGNEGFNKIILLGAPNKGIVGDVAALCPLVGGEKRECDDMNSDSLFMQKLNSQIIPDNVYSIYAVGCEMQNGQGDGIVLEENARLENAKNYVINGTCRGKFQPLHIDLLHVDMYPEVADIILDILNS